MTGYYLVGRKRSAFFAEISGNASEDDQKMSTKATTSRKENKQEAQVGPKENDSPGLEGLLAEAAEVWKCEAQQYGQEDAGPGLQARARAMLGDPCRSESLSHLDRRGRPGVLRALSKRLGFCGPGLSPYPGNSCQ